MTGLKIGESKIIGRSDKAGDWVNEELSFVYFSVVDLGGSSGIKSEVTLAFRI